jgi:hypothetical protein
MGRLGCSDSTHRLRELLFKLNSVREHPAERFSSNSINYWLKNVIRKAQRRWHRAHNERYESGRR